EVGALVGHTAAVRSVTFSPDGKILASGSDDKTVKVWQVAARRELATFKGIMASPYSVAFAPDGRTLALGSSDKTVKLWDLAGQRFRPPLKGLHGAVWGVVFSPDGKTLASGLRSQVKDSSGLSSGSERFAQGRFLLSFALDDAQQLGVGRQVGNRIGSFAAMIGL